MKYRLLFILMTSLVFCSTLIAQHEKPQKPHHLIKKESTGWVAAPYITYAPETGTVFGAAGIYYFYTDSSVSDKDRPSHINLNVMYSTKKQSHLAVPFDLYFKEMTYRIGGRLVFEHYPFKYYGIGNDTQESDEEDYTPNTFGIDFSIMRQLSAYESGEGFNLGLHIDYRHDNIVSIEEGKMLDTSPVPGKEGGTVMGLGLDMNWDTRDNIFASFQGSYFDIKATFYGKLIGSDYAFQRYFFDARKYFPIKFGKNTHVLAIQAVLDASTGTVPFYALPTFGGDLAMRGFFLGRYRDKLSTYIQTDYRFPVWWRFGMILFGSVGQVAPLLDKLAVNSSKFAAGIGLRIDIIPEERMAVRFDLGFSKDGSQFYITFGEAF